MQGEKHATQRGVAKALPAPKLPIQQRLGTLPKTSPKAQEVVGTRKDQSLPLSNRLDSTEKEKLGSETGKALPPLKKG